MATKYLFKLRFPQRAIREWAERCPAESDMEIENVIAPIIIE
jgi:hypothetical protein